MKTLNKIWKNQAGQDFVEYALIAGFVATAAASASPAIAAVVARMTATMNLLDTALKVTAS
jgi:Flp pilus assembly pilin Flp